MKDETNDEAVGDYVVVTRPGSELSETDRANCVAIIAEGGAVNTGSANQELPRASLVAMVYCDNVIVGVGAIKRARPAYGDRKGETERLRF